MAESTNHLRVRVSENIDDQRTKIEVLDADDNVLGDLAWSVSTVTWKSGGQGGPGIVRVELACERVTVESIESPANRRQT